jgi:hypothetical protein
VGFDDPLHDGKTDTGAFSFPVQFLEQVEDSGQIPGIDPNTVVCNKEDRFVPSDINANPYDRVGPVTPVLDGILD